MTEQQGSLSGRVLALPVIAYRRFIRPMRASASPTCRFEPSCSEYAIEALRVWGPIRGAWLAVRRLARCQPWGGIGMDPVPQRGVAAADPAGTDLSRTPAEPPGAESRRRSDPAMPVSSTVRRSPARSRG